VNGVDRGGPTDRRIQRNQKNRKGTAPPVMNLWHDRWTVRSVGYTSRSVRTKCTVVVVVFLLLLLSYSVVLRKYERKCRLDCRPTAC